MTWFLLVFSAALQCFPIMGLRRPPSAPRDAERESCEIPNLFFISEEIVLDKEVI
jgi:hypothetical protein